ncbi:MAG: DUF4303 domain-containing protein [Lentisphaeraceae bacterium]|nr:DUF4303 domain-containing protein [Lentisphaeraceae bacterium]
MKNIEQTIISEAKQAINKFKQSFPSEKVYGFALVPSSLGNYVVCAIATEERLTKTAEGYDYPFTLEKKKAWLKWANPDDGWYQDTFDDFKASSKLLETAIETGQLEEYDERVSSIMVNVLKVLKEEKVLESAIYSLTHAEDPQEFIYWAKQINPELAKSLAKDYEVSQEIEDEIFDLEDED